MVWKTLSPDEMAKDVKLRLYHFYEDAAQVEKVKDHAKEFSYEKHIAAYIKLYKELLSLPNEEEVK